MLGFDALDVQPLDTISALVYVAASGPLLVAVEVPVASMGAPVDLAPLALAVVLPPATLSPTLTAAPLEIAVVLPALFVAMPATALEIAVVLPAATLVALGRPAAALPFTLLAQLEFASPAPLTLYVSDHYVPATLDVSPAPAGHEWLPYVAAWGALDELVSAGAPATSEITFFNTKPIAGKSRFSDLLRTPLNAGAGTYEFAGAKITLYRLDTGTGVVSRLLNALYIEEPTEIDDRLFRLRMSDQGLLLEDRLVSTTIDRTAFPNASRAVVGRTIPKPFGVLRTVPCTPVVDGPVGRLAADMTAVQASCTLVDSSDFPAANGNVMIDGEVIGYTTNTVATGVLSGLGRAVGGTVAAAHTAQSQAFYIRGGAQAYRYVVGEMWPTFAIKSVSNIRVNGNPPRTAPTVALVDGGLVAGKYFSLIDFNSGATAAAVAAYHVQPTQGARLTTSGTLDVGPANPLPDKAFTPAFGALGSEINIRSVQGRIQFTVQTISGTWNGHAAQLWAGAVGTGQLLYDSVNALQLTGTASFAMGAAVSNMPIIYHTRVIGGGPGTNDVHVVFTIQQYDVIVDSAGPASGAADSTAGRVIGEVTCDVEGIMDDAAGVVSGTASLLLENPADVMRFILTQLYGVAVADLGARWPASRAALAGFGYRWAFLLGFEGPDKLSDLRTRFAQQSRSELFIEGGKWDLVTIPAAPVAIVTLDYARDVWSERPALASRTPRPQVFTSVRAEAQHNYASGDFDYTAVAKVAGLAAYVEESLTFDFVQDKATADALAAFWLAQWQRQRWEIDLVAWRNVLALRKGDHVALTGHPILTAHGGALLIFRILERSYLSGDPNPARIRLRAREGNA